MGHREQLLAGAKRCLYERGYAQTTARDVVAASGTNLASIGYHFGSKEALLNAAMIEAMTDWGDELGRAIFIDPADEPLQRLETILSRVIDSIQSNRPLWAASLDAFPQTEQHPQLREQFVAAYQASRSAFAALLLDGDGDGPVDEAAAVDPRPSADAVGSLVMAIVAGLTTQWLLDPESAPSAHAMAVALRAVAQPRA